MFFTNMADFYTDTVFCLLLFINDDKYILALIAAIFTFGPHIISIILCLYHLQIWRKLKIEYIEQYDNLIIAITVLAGVYPTIDFLSSKLFYIKQISLYLTKKQILSLKQCRFFNNILLLC